MNALSKPRAHAGFLNAIVRISEAAGIDTAPTLRRNDIRLDMSLDTDTSVTVDAVRNVCRDIAHASGNEFFVWTEVLNADSSGFGYFSHLALTAPTLGDAFESLARNIAIMVSESIIQIDDDGPVTRITYTVQDEGTAPCRELSEAVVAFGVGIGRKALGPDWGPDTIYFEHGRPETIAPYVNACNCDLVFNAPACGMSFPRTCLSAEMPGANIYLQKAVENYIVNVVGRNLGYSRVALEVRSEIAACLQDGPPGLDDIATRMATSPRTLQRRLREADTSFSDVLEELRVDLAERMLADENLPVSEVGYRLGYADASSFDRAYRGWTGRTPKSAREPEI